MYSRWELFHAQQILITVLFQSWWSHPHREKRAVTQEIRPNQSVLGGRGKTCKIKSPWRIHLNFPYDGTINLSSSLLAFTAQGQIFTAGTITLSFNFQMCRCARHRGAPLLRVPMRQSALVCVFCVDTRGVCGDDLACENVCSGFGAATDTFRVGRESRKRAKTIDRHQQEKNSIS